MIVWSTQFPILPNSSVDDLILLCRKWLVGSPHSNWLESEIPDSMEKEIVNASKRGHSISIGRAKIGSEDYCGFRHQWQDEYRRDWVTEICGYHTGQRFLVGVHLHCSTTDTGIPLPRPRKPYIVKQILSEIGGDIDGELHVCDEARVLNEVEVDMAARLLKGEISHSLPVIYASVKSDNCPPFDVQKLARWAGGMAHVVIEPSRRFSFILAKKVNRINPYDGAVSIYWQRGSGRFKHLFPYHYPDQKSYAGAISDIIRKALAGRRPEFRCTWDYLRELIVRQKIETLRREGKASVDEYISAFDEELRLTKSRLEEAEKEIGRLKHEIAKRDYESDINTDGLLAAGLEKDLFAGEQRDILVHALNIAYNNAQPGGRIRDVLKSLLEVNLPTGESKRIEAAIREVLGSCNNIGKLERRALEDIGFSISEEGKHLKLVFMGDDRYTFSMSKTGSDWRGTKNWISDVTKRLFK